MCMHCLKLKGVGVGRKIPTWQRLLPQFLAETGVTSLTPQNYGANPNVCNIQTSHLVGYMITVYVQNKSHDGLALDSHVSVEDHVVNPG